MSNCYCHSENNFYLAYVDGIQIFLDCIYNVSTYDNLDAYNWKSFVKLDSMTKWKPFVSIII